MKKILLSLIVVLSGCNMFDSHVRQMETLQAMSASVADRLNDGALAQFHASGAAVNPGIAMEAAVVYRVIGRFEGISGQFSTVAQGELGPAGQAGTIFENIITNSNLTRQQQMDFLFQLISAGVDVNEEIPVNVDVTPAPTNGVSTDRS